MKKIVMIALASIAFVCSHEPEKKKEYKKLPKEGYFSITNNNSQNFNFEETRREVSVSVQRPPVVINNQPPQQQPQYHQPYNQPSTQHKGNPNNPSYSESQHQIHYHHEAHDYFSPFYAKIQQIPTLFTTKNCFIALGAVACSYAALYFLLMRYANNAKKNTGWGSFQEHIPPADLKSLDTLALADGIIEEIKARYPLINPANLMPSILLFNKDIEKELDELNDFINFYTFIITYKLTSLFPNQEKLIIKAQTKIQRLHIVRDAITEWINTHVTRLIRNQPIPKHTTQEMNNDDMGVLNEKCIAFLVHE